MNKFKLKEENSVTTFLTIYKSKDQNFDFLSLLEKAKDAGIINDHHYYRYLADWQQKLYDLVLLYNYAQSTSISNDEYIFIYNCLNYVLHHGYDSMMALADTSLIKIFDEGIEALKANAQKIQKLLAQIIAKPLNKAFANYQNLLYEQIPSYLAMLQGADAIFAHAYLNDDIVYPLIDGTPLQNNLYGLNGSDMVCHYLERLHFETNICYHFHDELDGFIKAHDQQYGLSFSDLDINMLLPIITQAIAHYWLYHDLGLYLAQDDITKLKKRLGFHDLHTALNDAFMFFSSFFMPADHAYLYQHYQLLYERFLLFIKENATILVIASAKPITRLLLDPPLNKAAFMRLLAYLNEQQSIQDKIMILNKAHLNIYDLCDLLDNDIFYDMEYHDFYQSLDMQAIALLLKSNFNEFSAQETLSRKNIAMIDPSTSWQEQLINFIKEFDDKQLAQLSFIMSSFEISK